MFDVGFSEILLIAVVALVILGPERLPKAARFTGLWVRRARSQWDSVKTEFEREMAAEDLKRSIAEARRQASEVARDMGSVQDDLRQAVDDARDSGNAAQHASSAVTAAVPSAAAADTAVADTATDTLAGAAACEAVVAEPGRSVSLEDPLPGAVPAPSGERQHG